MRKRHIFWVNGNILHLDRGVGYMGITFIKNSMKCSLRYIHFTAHGFYLRKVLLINGRNYSCILCKSKESKEEETFLCISIQKATFFPHLRNHHFEYTETHTLYLHVFYPVLYSHIFRTENIYQPRVISLLCPWKLLFLTAGF